MGSVEEWVYYTDEVENVEGEGTVLCVCGEGVNVGHPIVTSRDFVA